MIRRKMLLAFIVSGLMLFRVFPAVADHVHLTDAMLDRHAALVQQSEEPMRERLKAAQTRYLLTVRELDLLLDEFEAWSGAPHLLTAGAVEPEQPLPPDSQRIRSLGSRAKSRLFQEYFDQFHQIIPDEHAVKSEFTRAVSECLLSNTPRGMNEIPDLIAMIESAVPAHERTEMLLAALATYERTIHPLLLRLVTAPDFVQCRMRWIEALRDDEVAAHIEATIQYMEPRARLREAVLEHRARLHAHLPMEHREDFLFQSDAILYGEAFDPSLLNMIALNIAPLPREVLAHLEERKRSVAAAIEMIDELNTASNVRRHAEHIASHAFRLPEFEWPLQPRYEHRRRSLQQHDVAITQLLPSVIVAEADAAPPGPAIDRSMTAERSRPLLSEHEAALLLHEFHLNDRESELFQALFAAFRADLSHDQRLFEQRLEELARLVNQWDRDNPTGENPHARAIDELWISWKEQRLAAEKLFYENVRNVMGVREAADWARLARTLERRRLLDSAVPLGLRRTMDLDLLLREQCRGSLDEAQRNLLDEYHRTLSHAIERMLHEHARILKALSEAPRGGAHRQRLIEQSVTGRFVVEDVQRAFAANLAGTLPADAAEKFLDMTWRQTYPDLFAQSPISFMRHRIHQFADESASKAILDEFLEYERGLLRQIALACDGFDTIGNTLTILKGRPVTHPAANLWLMRRDLVRRAILKACSESMIEHDAPSAAFQVLHDWAMMVD